MNHYTRSVGNDFRLLLQRSPRCAVATVACTRREVAGILELCHCIINCIIISRRAGLGLTALAEGVDHADLFVSVRSLPEDLLAANDPSRTRQEAGQMSEVRQSEGSAALRVVWG